MGIGISAIAQQQKPALLPATLGIAHSNDNQQPSGARMPWNSNQELFEGLKLWDQPRYLHPTCHNLPPALLPPPPPPHPDVLIGALCEQVA